MVLSPNELVSKFDEYKSMLVNTTANTNIYLSLLIHLICYNERLRENVNKYIDKVIKIAKNDINIDRFIMYTADEILSLSGLHNLNGNHDIANMLYNNDNNLTNIDITLYINIYIIVLLFICNYICVNDTIIKAKFDALNNNTTSENYIDLTQHDKLQRLNVILTDGKAAYSIYYVLTTDNSSIDTLINNVFDTKLAEFYTKLLPSNIININIGLVDVRSMLISKMILLTYIDNSFNEANIKNEVNAIKTNENGLHRQVTKPRTTVTRHTNDRNIDYDAYNNFFNMDHSSVLNRYCVNCSNCSSCICCYECSQCFMCSYCAFTKKSTMSMFVDQSKHINHCCNVVNSFVDQYCNNIVKCNNCTRLNNANNCYNVRDSACLSGIISYKHIYGTLTKYLDIDTMKRKSEFDRYSISNCLDTTNSNTCIFLNEENEWRASKTQKSATKLSIRDYNQLRANEENA